MKKSDSAEECVETYTGCPECFQNVKLDGDEHHHEDEIVNCPLCGNDFRLGEIQ